MSAERNIPEVPASAAKRKWVKPAIQTIEGRKAQGGFTYITPDGPFYS